jgi:hypothetical protein
VKRAFAEYWRSLPAPGPHLPSPNLDPARHGRFSVGGRPGAEIRFLDPYEGGGEIFGVLAGGALPYEQLVRSLRPVQLRLVKRMIAAEMLTVSTPARGSAA